MELTQGSETSANYNCKLTPGKYPKEHIQYTNNGESLKLTTIVRDFCSSSESLRQSVKIKMFVSCFKFHEFESGVSVHQCPHPRVLLLAILTAPTVYRQAHHAVISTPSRRQSQCHRQAFHHTFLQSVFVLLAAGPATHIKFSTPSPHFLKRKVETRLHISTQSNTIISQIHQQFITAMCFSFAQCWPYPKTPMFPPPPFDACDVRNIKPAAAICLSLFVVLVAPHD
jgi:hypothetical protein